MNEPGLATKFAEQVVSDTQFWVAAVGIIGSLLPIFGNFTMHWYKEKPKRDLDSKENITL